ncbi:hypothetical protein M0R45_015276 [Rubus argutus]|uniref:Uncharacterized protein n=1 Tax=Rubus argutus TaxID=59490 RepID=A0AAW1XQB7_RUBAR
MEMKRLKSIQICRVTSKIDWAYEDWLWTLRRGLNPDATVSLKDDAGEGDSEARLKFDWIRGKKNVQVVWEDCWALQQSEYGGKGQSWQPLLHQKR